MEGLDASLEFSHFSYVFLSEKEHSIRFPKNFHGDLNASPGSIGMHREI